MKRSKKIYILAAVLLFACLSTFVLNRYQEHVEKIKETDQVILEIPSDSVKSLSWEYKSKTLAFHKDEKWFYDEDEAFPVDEEKINDRLNLFKEFGASFIIEEVEDYGQYGLDDPVCTINLSTGDRSYEIKLGDYSKMDLQRYVSIGDGNVYLVKKDPLNFFDGDLRDMIDNDKIPSLDEVTEIQFAGRETYNILYEEDSPRAYSDDDVYIANINGKNLPLDKSRVDKYLRNISNLNLTDYVTYKASDEDLKSYGLDSPELTVTVKYTEKDEKNKEIADTFVLNISRDPKERKDAEKASKKDSKNTEKEEITAYARVGQSQIVYKLETDDYRELMAASYDSLRHLEVFPADFADIKQIDIRLEGNDYIITSQKKGNDRTYYYKTEKLDITDFQKAMENLKADSFTDESPGEIEEISLTVYLDNKNYPKLKIQLYRYDGIHCLAVVDREPVSLVKRSDVVALIEAVHAFVLK